jgi:phosphate transport system substrate-binding protein
VLTALGVVAATAPAAQAVSYPPITGSGSTWSQNALDQWRANVKANYAMTVNYSGVGSTIGRKDFQRNTVDYAVSEIEYQRVGDDQEALPPAGSYAYMPIVAGGTSIMYNLKINGKRVTNLRLSGEVVTKIFTGVIKKWNDPAIRADNPGLAMPARAITPVTRSDGSGTTAQFTSWMLARHRALWCAFYPKCNSGSKLSQFPATPGFKAQSGSLGVAGYVSQGYGEGAITYVEYSYALKSGFPVAKLLNEAGYYVEPTASSVAVALMAANINKDTKSPDYLTQILDGVYANRDKRTYPMSSYSYMIVPTTVRGGTFNADKGVSLGAFGRYFLCEGQQQAESLGYSPLPMNLVLAGADQIKRIPGAGGAGVDINKCNNPTFKAGQSPSSNQLAKTAPMPAACDKRGPTQCTTGTAGAKGQTATTAGVGAGTSGTVAGGASGTVAGGAQGAAPGSPAALAAAAAAGDPAAVAAAGAPKVDAEGVPIGSVPLAGGVAASASPVDLAAAGGWGPAQTLMVLAALFVLGLIVAPPLLASRLRQPTGATGGAR